MRPYRVLANALGVALLAAGAFAMPNPIVRPPRADAVADARLDDTRPLDLSVTHKLFLTPITERLDTADEVRLERYLWTVVPTGRRIIFPDEQLRPVGSVELTPEQYRRWDALASTRAHQYLDTIATQSFRVRLPTSMRNRRVPWRTGYADRFVDALDRAAPYIPYLESMASQRGLPRDTWLLAVQESLFRPTAVSSAWCEGPFQLSRPAARTFGLVVPRLARGGNTTQVNESLHPLLAAQAAFDLLYAYAYHTGGFLTGVSAYHTGPGNLAKMRILQLRHPQWRSQEDAGVPAMIAERYLHGIDAALFDPVTEMSSLSGDETESPGDVTLESTVAADGLSWIVSDGWRHPSNTRSYSGYRRESSLYVPRFLALRNALRRDALFRTERELAGMRRIPAGNGTCGPRGPYTTDLPVCWISAPVFHDVERYAKKALDLDMVAIRYRTPPRAGKEPLTGEDLAQAVGDLSVFTAYNPHIPRKARIPEGTRVALPPGTAASFITARPLRDLLDTAPVTTYRDGVMSASSAPTAPLAEDREYARLALLRSDGRYDEVDPEAVCALADRMEAIDDGSLTRSLQRRVSRLDCALTSHRSSRSLLRLADEHR